MRKLSEKQLWERLQNSVTIDPITSCWLILNGKYDAGGYVEMYVHRRHEQAHRFAFRMTYGQITAKVIRHTCDVPNCINPKHLIEGSQRQNVADMVAKNRQAKGENHSKVKLTEIQVLEIVEDQQSSNLALAEKYGVKATTISAIRNGYSWNYITKKPLPKCKQPKDYAKLLSPELYKKLFT